MPFIRMRIYHNQLNPIAHKTQFDSYYIFFFSIKSIIYSATRKKHEDLKYARNIC